MGYLLIKDLNIKQISLLENNYAYKLIYNDSNLRLNGITIRLYDISIVPGLHDYTIHIKDDKSKQLVISVDTLLRCKTSCGALIKGDAIHIKKNNIVDSLIKEYTDTIDIYISIIKKSAYQTYPIVYIL